MLALWLGHRASGLLLIAVFLAGAATMWALLPGYAVGKPVPQAAEDTLPKRPDKTRSNPQASFTPVTFAAIPGWAGDDHGAALGAFKATCRNIVINPERFANDPSFGTPEEWTALCRAALTVKKAGARAYFEQNFEPATVSAGSDGVGLVTGYYEPELEGSRSWSMAYTTPVFAKPTDLVIADPTAFADILRGERLAGRVVAGTLVPYDTRAEIESFGYAARNKPILYLRSRADSFFLQVQGSGRVKLAEGGDVRLGYDGQNGHPYASIGAILVNRGEIARDKMSMQAIRAWLIANPHEADALMDRNPSYVFFAEKTVDGDEVGPEGASGVALTPGRSLAVDKRVYPYGVPIFVRAEVGAAKGEGREHIDRLMIAQDTGGAIRGVIRGDVFFGWGDEAEHRAGLTAGPAQFYILRPKPPKLPEPALPELAPTQP